jgi:hypothetical protein
MQKRGMKQETIDKIDFVKGLILLDKNPDYIAVHTGLSSLGSVGGVREFINRYAKDFVDELNAWSMRHRKSSNLRMDINVKSDNKDMLARLQYYYPDVNYENAYN